MTVDDALNILEKVLDKQPLNNIQKLVFRGVWDHQSYMDIAKRSGYDYGYVKDIGYELWRCLSELLGEKVTKHNIQNVLKRYDQRATTLSVHDSSPSDVSALQSISQPSVPQFCPLIEDQETRWAGRSQLIEAPIQI
jgi:hypothetical protein